MIHGLFICNADDSCTTVRIVRIIFFRHYDELAQEANLDALVSPKLH